jgi:hypothetical protein
MPQYVHLLNKGQIGSNTKLPVAVFDTHELMRQFVAKELIDYHEHSITDEGMIWMGHSHDVKGHYLSYLVKLDKIPLMN